MLLSEYVNGRVEELLAVDRHRTACAYRSVLRSIASFCGTEVSLDKAFSREFLFLYQKYLLSKGRSVNTISFYMRMLRSLYNQAVEREVVVFVPKLFSEVCTANDATVKRAASADVIHRLLSLCLPACSKLAFSRDVFLLSIYLQGISFVDLAFLKKADLRGEMISYFRRKTGSKVNVGLIPEAKALIEKYLVLTVGTSYLLPIIVAPGKDERRQYESALRTYNRHLKQLAVFSGISDNLTSYVARHSWATTAYHSGVAVSVISQAMGHKTEEVTRIYLASFSLEVLSEANEAVFAALSSGDERPPVPSLGGCSRR